MPSETEHQEEERDVSLEASPTIFKEAKKKEEEKKKKKAKKEPLPMLRQLLLSLKVMGKGRGPFLTLPCPLLRLGTKKKPSSPPLPMLGPLLPRLLLSAAWLGQL